MKIVFKDKKDKERFYSKVKLYLHAIATFAFFGFIVYTANNISKIDDVLKLFQYGFAGVVLAIGCGCVYVGYYIFAFSGD